MENENMQDIDLVQQLKGILNAAGSSFSNAIVNKRNKNLEKVIPEMTQALKYLKEAEDLIKRKIVSIK